jgi:16S rRNA processing protein RimM
MKKEDFFYLGKITKTFGSGAKFSARLDTDEPEKYEDLEVLFLDINHTFIPFFIQAISLKENTAILEFEDETSDGIEELIVGAKIYLPAEVLPELKGNKFYFHEVKKFKMTDGLKNFRYKTINAL